MPVRNPIKTKGRKKKLGKNVRFAAKNKARSPSGQLGRKANATRTGASSNDIKLAIIGVGNVASVLVQAIYSSDVGGIWHESIGGFRKKDIKVVAAFDVDSRKVGKDLSEAIYSDANVSPRFFEVPHTSVLVQAGITGYEVPKHLKDVTISSDNFIDLLRDSEANLVVNLIPSGMQRTCENYARASIDAGCDFINATPASIASDGAIRDRFAESGRIVVGDDLLSQFGGTAFHKGILDFMNNRGVTIDKSYQLDVGGGSETLNTINEQVRLEKREIKTESISDELPYKFQTVAGTTDFVDYLGNNRTSYFWIQGKSFFDSDIKVDVYLRTNDSANAGNILLDVIRAVARARQQKRCGSPQEICDYGFKKLKKPAPLRKAHEEFLDRYS